MAISLHNLKPSAKKKFKRVGRGHGSGKGTTAGRGQKGQKSRSGVSGLKRLGMRKLLLSTPKLRGFISQAPQAQAINLADIEKHFGTNAPVSPKTLLKKGLIKTTRRPVKILSKGALTIAVSVSGCLASDAAKKAITAVGGSIS